VSAPGLLVCHGCVVWTCCYSVSGEPVIGPPLQRPNSLCSGFFYETAISSARWLLFDAMVFLYETDILYIIIKNH
jgi:hypothetical protein